jgi:hypothetical protein
MAQQCQPCNTTNQVTTPSQPAPTSPPLCRPRTQFPHSLRPNSTPSAPTPLPPTLKPPERGSVTRLPTPFSITKARVTSKKSSKIIIVITSWPSSCVCTSLLPIHAFVPVFPHFTSSRVRQEIHSWIRSVSAYSSSTPDNNTDAHKENFPTPCM